MLKFVTLPINWPNFPALGQPSGTLQATRLPSMNQQSIFISCVSPEFRQTRSRVAAILTRLGYTPVIQEIFGTEPSDLREVLRDKIDACNGLIQIIGHGYGAEPPTVDTDYGRVSYTQFEFLYARSQKKKTWLLFAGDACTRDTPLDRLDLPLPNDSAHPDPASYQAERRALQLDYRDTRRNDGHFYYDATSDTDLELKVERLRDELAELRQADYSGAIISFQEPAPDSPVALLNVLTSGEFPKQAEHRQAEIRAINHTPAKTERNPVDCTVFAPARVKRKQAGLLQVFLHAPEDRKQVGRTQRSLILKVRSAAIGPWFSMPRSARPLRLTWKSKALSSLSEWTRLSGLVIRNRRASVLRYQKTANGDSTREPCGFR